MSRYTYTAALGLALLSSAALAQSGNNGFSGNLGNGGSGQCFGCTGVDAISQTTVSAGGNPGVSSGLAAGLEKAFGNDKGKSNESCDEKGGGKGCVAGGKGK